MLKKTKRKLQKKTVQKTEITSTKTLGTSNRKTLAVLLEESKTFSVAKRSDSPSHYKPVPLGVLLNCCWAGWSELVDDGRHNVANSLYARFALLFRLDFSEKNTDLW